MERTKRILVVEDDDAILDSLVEILENEGYEVSTAPNGEEALARLGIDVPPDVILLDLRMPVMDGWSFRNAQKKAWHLASIPVVAMSADGSSQAEAISASAFLHKPFHLRDLLKTIARVLAEDEQHRKSSHRESVERLASLGRLAAGVGHEINNPLAFVLLNVTLANARLKKIASREGSSQPSVDREVATELRAEEARELTQFLDDSLVGLERIRVTVQTLQSLTRKVDDKWEAVIVEKVLDESIAMARNHFQHRARLVKRYDAAPVVRGSASAIGQVFLNLLINAAQAIPEGDAGDNEISVRTYFDGVAVVVEITDTGRGIPADVVPRIFEPFFTTKSAEAGTGLGLAICQQIVTDHGGVLAIESELTRGTICRLSLPPDRESTPALVPEAPHSVPTSQVARRARVLVIDDEEMIGQVIKRLLSPRHDVVACKSAQEAFDLLGRGHDFDLVLCDMLMPNVGGTQIFDELAVRWPMLVPRLAFMTGGVSSPEATEFLGRVRLPVLYKPFTPADLEAMVDARLERARPVPPGGPRRPRKPEP